MKIEEYKAQRDSLFAEATKMIDDGNLTEAAVKKQAIEDLDRQFDAEKQAKADLNAMKNVVPVAPEIIKNASTMGEGNKNMEKVFDASTAEYRNAFFKHLLGQDDQMTKEENAAFVHTTGNTTAPLPTTMLNEIWDLVDGQHSILGDITVYRTGTILEVVKHTTIVAGKAKKVAEGVANDDEKNTMVKVTLSGNDFSKNVDISYAEATMSIDALEQYLTNEIAAGIGEAMADDVVAQIATDMNSANALTSATAGVFTFAEVAKAFGSLKRVAAPVAYMTRATLYNYLVAMVDASNRPIYVPNANAAEPGMLLGAQVKIEDSVADGKIIVGDPTKVVYNMIQDIMIETDKDIKTHTYTYSGYARGQGALIDDKAFASLTVKTA